MNIILVSGNLRRIRTLRLSRWQTGTLTVLTGLAMFFASGWAYTRLFGAEAPSIVALAEKAVNSFRHPAASEQAQNATSVREDINALALKLGEMQAQLLRLDAVGQRLARSAGLSASEFRFDQIPARGGAAPSAAAQQMNVGEVDLEIKQLARLIDDRRDKLEVIDAFMLNERIREKKMPTVTPVAIGWRSSGFGYRSDPLNGSRAFHEGLDFVAEVGTPVVSAAAGVVAASELQSEYGNIIEIDHGNGFTTRYAHLSKRLVNVGDVVFKGHQIAEVGSTGRSTGAHLHFEVRNQGQAVDPSKFLEKDS
jgi:murein DD-endopeptidase MepM/ murein hydrolase activator NlpD